MSIRKNITMSDKTAQWYEDRANEMGVSQSAIMAMALAEYMKQETAIKSIDEMMTEFKKQQGGKIDV